MEHKDIIDCLNFIRPNAKWKLVGDVLEWQDNEQTKPSQVQIETGWIAYQAKIESDKAEAEAKRSAALAKLEALGLDEDDLKALGL